MKTEAEAAEQLQQQGQRQRRRGRNSVYYTAQQYGQFSNIPCMDTTPDTAVSNLPYYIYLSCRPNNLLLKT